ncbi:hypothetical protein CYMTET_42992 [Cymbomonas tetramitiformis]|uniref:Uncharacterized protein n=1 Tax=Cymbomonas tetramitiformis TaxID=36881 RepID=A0AAE0C325_9CHLO|nr:hypothetical protein CYMTET_42992 [Cymbomonas tetramitiformis]
MRDSLLESPDTSQLKSRSSTADGRYASEENRGEGMASGNTRTGTASTTFGSEKTPYTFGDAVFRMRVFWYTWFTQLLYPLSLPLVIYLQGWSSLRTYQYLPAAWSLEAVSLWAFQFIFSVHLIANVVLIILGVNDFLHMQEFAVVCFLFLFHRFMVATKYATLHEEEYDRLFSPNNHENYLEASVRPVFSSLVSAPSSISV